MGFGNPMEVLGAVRVIEHLTRLRKQGLDVFPDPLGSITDDTQAHLLFRNHTGLFDLLEGRAELRFVLALMPTEHMHDALAIEQVEAQALGIAPLPLPPRSPGPLVALAGTAPPGTLWPRGHIGPIDAQHQDRTTKAARCHRRDTPLDLVT